MLMLAPKFSSLVGIMDKGPTTSHNLSHISVLAFSLIQRVFI